MRRPLLALVLLLALPASAAAAQAPARSAIFFYPWYSNPRHDGQYVHWAQGGHAPPLDIASAFFPMRGPYSSGDPHVLGAQMRDIADSGRRRGRQLMVGPRVTGGPAPAVRHARGEATRPRGRRPARAVPGSDDRFDCSRPRLHPEPRSTRRLRLPHQGLHGRGVEPRHTTAHGAAALRADRTRGLRGTRGVRRLLYLRHRHLPRSEVRPLLQAGARARDPLCTVGGSRVRRAGGDRGHACQRPTVRRDVRLDVECSAPRGRRSRHDHVVQRVGEGTQIEPAGHGGGYESYDGAYGLHGRAAQRAYITRTAYWTSRF